MKSYKLVKPYFIENRFYVIVGIVCLIIVDMLRVFIPRIIKWAVDDLTTYQIDVIQLTRYAAYIVCVALGIGILRYIWRRCLIGTSRRVEEGLRNRLLKHIQTLSAPYFDRTRTGDLMAHATNDIMHIRMATGMGIVALTDAVFLGAAAIGFMFYINVKLALFALIPMPFIVMCAKFFGKKMHRNYQAVQAAFSDLTEMVRERFAGIRVVKAYNLETDSVARLKDMSEEYIFQNLFLVRITGSFFPLMVLLTNLSFAMVIFLGGRQTISSTITTGDFVAFISYLNLLTWPMMALGWVTNLIQRGAASLDRIDIILKTVPEIKPPKHPVSIGLSPLSLSFEQVSFSYGPDSAEALSNINMDLTEGQTMGIVGPPGSGKTTILNLIPRLYDVTEGRILIKGVHIDRLSLHDLRSHMSHVSQEPFLFSGTIRENIAFGSGEANEARLIEAARQAALYDTIASFPDGFDTIVGEKGVILSGGQKQRIALARALICEPPILVLDDPISQVDMETGTDIINTLRAISLRKIIVIASHRLSAIRHADQIMVLKDGRIEGMGTHEELVASNAYYSKTCSMQEIEEEVHGFG